MAGNISALCFNGAEKTFSASVFSLRAIATEPFLLDVSTARIRGLSFILLIFDSLCVTNFFRNPRSDLKKSVFKTTFFCKVFLDYLIKLIIIQILWAKGL